MLSSFYLQYKISTYHDSYLGAAAKYSAQVGNPFYLTKVRGPKIGNQHNVLRILGNKSKNVYYCAPKFYKFLDLNTYFSSNTIFDNSILISISKLPDINDVKSHSIAYSEDGQKTAFFSKPVDVKSESF